MFQHQVSDANKQCYTITIDYEIVRTPELVRHGQLLEPAAIEIEFSILNVAPRPATSEGCQTISEFCNSSALIEDLCLADDKQFTDRIREDFTYE